MAETLVIVTSGPGRPPGVTDREVELARIRGERDLVGLASGLVYLRDSEKLPKWDCGCGTTGIPCAQGECPHCGVARPETHADPEQGEGEELGYFRLKARGLLARDELTGLSLVE